MNHNVGSVHSRVCSQVGVCEVDGEPSHAPVDVCEVGLGDVKKKAEGRTQKKEDRKESQGVMMMSFMTVVYQNKELEINTVDEHSGSKRSHDQVHQCQVTSPAISSSAEVYVCTERTEGHLDNPLAGEEFSSCNTKSL